MRPLNTPPLVDDGDDDDEVEIFSNTEARQRRIEEEVEDVTRLAARRAQADAQRARELQEAAARGQREGRRVAQEAWEKRKTEDEVRSWRDREDQRALEDRYAQEKRDGSEARARRYREKQRALEDHYAGEARSVARQKAVAKKFADKKRQDDAELARGGADLALVPIPRDGNAGVAPDARAPGLDLDLAPRDVEPDARAPDLEPALPPRDDDDVEELVGAVGGEAREVAEGIEVAAFVGGRRDGDEPDEVRGRRRRRSTRKLTYDELYRQSETE